MKTSEVLKTLSTGSKMEKIEVLKILDNSKDLEAINKIISKLDDPDIEVRGEAFSSLVINENNISEMLISSLASKNKIIRGYCALVLANRHNVEAIHEIVKLTKDPSSMVRACALGALGYLKAKNASEAILISFSDDNLEVKKSALKAAIDISYKIPSTELEKLKREKDSEIRKLILIAEKKGN